jgi:hypothetical protein
MAMSTSTLFQSDSPAGRTRTPSASISAARADGRAWVAKAPKQPLVLEAIDLGPLGPEDVEVAVEHCGLCHSDLSVSNPEVTPSRNAKTVLPERSTTMSAKSTPPTRPDMKLEVVVLGVSDVDRAKAFYENLGWRLDADLATGEDFRVVQLTPSNSEASIIFGKGSPRPSRARRTA